MTKTKTKADFAIRTKQLSKKYGDLVALAPLDLSIKKGERVALIGSNGSGKTTLLRLVAGLLERSGGDVEVFGHDAGTIDARAAVSYIPDEPVLYDDLSVREHVEYLGPLNGRQDWSEVGDGLMEKLGIAHRADDLPSGFSRGLKQKTSLTIGLVRQFDLLLIDEPFVGLDEPGKLALLELLDGIQREGTTIVLASHQLELVGRASRCIALRDGEITYDGAAKHADVAKLVGA